MKKFFVAILVLATFITAGSFALVEKAPELDYALSCLEKGNPFLERYNEITGSEIEPLMELGVPYFWGGGDEKLLGHIRTPWDSSTYYKKDRFYMCGFDCSGFTRWVLQKTGKEKHPSLSFMLSHYYDMRDYYLDFDDLSYDEIAKKAQVGDLFVIRYKGGRHIMMFMGTLRDFAYNEENVPEELVPYLEKPLMIHSSKNPDYYKPYEEYIEKTFKISKVVPPEGGCMVSLLDVPVEKTTGSAQVYHRDNYVYYFDLENYHLTVYDMDLITNTRWVRWDKESAKK